MSVDLDNAYFEWLYGQVADPRKRNPRNTYWHIFRQMYTKEFVWLIPNDDNRFEDGRGLRDEFLSMLCEDHYDPNWRDIECSFLEMIIGLSRRLAFEAEGESSRWFWRLMENLKISEFDDAFYSGGTRSEDVIDGVLDVVIWRQYKPNGEGGLFPLKEFHQDQAKVEIWYQMHAYILENT